MKSVCRGPFLVAVYGVFVLRTDVIIKLRGDVVSSRKVVSPTHRSLLIPMRYPWYSFLLEVESTQGP